MSVAAFLKETRRPVASYVSTALLAAGVVGGIVTGQYPPEYIIAALVVVVLGDGGYRMLEKRQGTA